MPRKEQIITLLRTVVLGCLLIAGFGCSAKDAGHSLTELEDDTSGLTAEQHESLGDTAFKGGNLKLAYTHYAQAIAQSPSDLDLHLKQGVLLLAEHQDDMALEEFRAVLEVEPDNALANEGAGTVYYRSGLEEEAKVSFERALAVDPSMWMSLNYLGVLHSGRGEYSRAAEVLRKALAVNPRSDEALNNLGLTLTMSGDFEGAVEIFGKALSLGATDPRTYNNLGLVLARMGKYDKALQAFKMGGDESRAYNNLGYVLLLEGKPAQASTCFEKAISLSPSFYVKASENLVRARRAAAFRDINGQSEEAVLPLTGTLMPVKPDVASSSVPAAPAPLIEPAHFPEPSSRTNAGVVPVVRPAAFDGRQEHGSSSTALETNAPPPAPGKGVESVADRASDASRGVVSVVPNAESVPVAEDVSITRSVPESGIGAQSAASVEQDASDLPRWGVHVSSWRKEAKAQRCVEELRAKGLPGHVARKNLPGKGLWFRVIAGEFDSYEAAEERRPEIMETLKLKTSFVRKFFVPAVVPDRRNV